VIPVPSKSLARCSESLARSKVPLSLAMELCVLPLTLRNNGTLVVATSKERAFEVERNLKFYTNSQIELHICEESFIQDAIKVAYKGSSEEIEAMAIMEDEPISKEILWGETDSQVVKLLEALIDYALVLGASDLHLNPKIDGVYAKFRIKGELRSTTKPIFSLSKLAQATRRLKVLARLNITGSSVQEGRFDLKETSIRVSIVPSLHGEKVALRFFGGSGDINFHSLGFSPAKREIIRTALKEKDGLIVVSGPTGSGKTTTLYSLVPLLKEHNIMSIEDPPERVLEDVTQICVTKDLSFSLGLKAILRQDPDVILVGEIRDSETARLANQAANTGHLVLSSLHSGSVEGVKLRFKQLGVREPNFKLIIVQRLAPILCEKCKVVDLNRSNTHKRKIFRRTGCAECDYTGIGARALLCEVSGLEESFEAQWNQLYFSGKVDTPWSTDQTCA